MLIQTWSDVLTLSFQNIWLGIANFVPNLVIAIIIFIIGWVIGALIQKVVAEIIKAIKLDVALKSAGVETLLNRAGFSLNSGNFIGALIKWFIIVVFLVASLEVLGLGQVNAFLQQVVLMYVPQVIVAVFVLIVAVVVADAMQKIVIGSAKAAGIKSAHFLGGVTKWSIWIFAIIVALAQLGIAVAFMQTLFTGVVIALALGFGLSFGLGGQDAAARYIEKVRSEIASK